MFMLKVTSPNAQGVHFAETDLYIDRNGVLNAGSYLGKSLHLPLKQSEISRLQLWKNAITEWQKHQIRWVFSDCVGSKDKHIWEGDDRLSKTEIYSACLDILSDCPKCRSRAVQIIFELILKRET